MHGSWLHYLTAVIIAIFVAWAGSALLPGVLGTIVLYGAGLVAVICLILMFVALVGGGRPGRGL